MINLILFLVQNIVQMLLTITLFVISFSVSVVQFDYRILVALQNSYRVSYIILQLYSTLYPPYI